MRKKLFSLVLIFLMLFAYMPQMAAVAYADDTYEGTAYISLSDDGKFVISDGEISDVVIAHLAVPLQEIADVNLAEWDLEQYSYTDYDTGEPDPDAPTVLKLYLYLLEHYYGGDNPLVASGAPHSFFMNTFWGHDCNLLYYVNGQYPLFEAGWGATADGVILHDGDFVDVAMYSDWGFYMDSNAGFNYFVKSDSDPEDGEITFEYNAVAGTPLTVKVARGMGNVDVGANTAYTAADDLTLHYGSEIDVYEESDLFLEGGEAEITFDEAGTYYVWVDGGLGDSSSEPCSCPAVAKVNVEAAPVQNTAPQLADGISSTAVAELETGETYSLDLANIFTDADGDELTYTISVNEGEAAAAAASYSYTPEAAGTYTLAFKANDGTVESEDTYTVTLTVTEPVPAGTDPTTFWNDSVDGNGWYAWSTGWNYVKTVSASGVSVKEYSWEGNTCQIVLVPTTYKDAAFTFASTSYARQGGIKIDGQQIAGSASTTQIELVDGTASITVQPYAGSRTGTTKTFVFTIEGGGVDALYAVELPAGTGYSSRAVGESVSPVTSRGSFSFAVDIAEGYKKGQNFAVKANGTLLSADENGTYTISNIKADQQITVEDVVTSDTVFYWNVTLPEGQAGYTVTAVEDSESPVAEGGSFRFKVTIAEGYAANADFAVKSNDAVLTPDESGIYTISDIAAHQQVTVSGVQDIYEVTLVSGTGYSVVACEGSASPVFSGSNYQFQVEIAEGYKKGADYTAKVNGTAVEPDANGIYTITNIREAKEVTVADVVTADTVNQYRVTLKETAGVSITPAEGYSSPVDEGNDYQFQVVLAPGYVRNGSFAVKANDTALTADDAGIYTISDIHGHQEITVTGVTQTVSVTAPAGSTITAGNLSGSFKYTWSDPAETVTNEDGSITSYFLPISGTTFYRVQNPNGATYWDFQSMAAGKAYTVTASDMKMDDDTFNKDTIYHDFYYNYLDLADIYLNINERNYLSMQPGASRELDAFRNWQAIESFTNAKIAIPDMHYEVVDINGKPSNLVTITPDAHNTCLSTITAGNESGMAIIKVTYDAMIHKQGYSSGFGAGGADTTRFSAIWPECTGIIVVTVGQDGSAIDMGMTINVGTPIAHAGKVAGDKIDAEHDLLYYFGNEGAEYTFKPEEGTTVSIARSTLTDKSLTYSGFTTDGITTDEDGNVTVTGLTAGRNIVKVEKDGLANYQVLSARKAILTAKDADGNVVDLTTKKFQPGETVSLSFDNVNSPQEKLATCYNNSFTIAYFGEDKPTTRLAFTNAGSHGYGQYNFSSMTQVITVVIPAEWEKDTYTISNGAVAMAGFSGCAAGGHRGKVTYNQASGMATGTGGTGVLGKLPDIVLKVGQNTPPHLAEGIAETVTAETFVGTPYTL
nr:hypothetical protein [Clostridia bacterium]